MIGMAAGVAATGHKVSATRLQCSRLVARLEQTETGGLSSLERQDWRHHGGLSVVEDGATHQCNEDIGLLCAPFRHDTSYHSVRRC